MTHRTLLPELLRLFDKFGLVLANPPRKGDTDPEAFSRSGTVKVKLVGSGSRNRLDSVLSRPKAKQILGGPRL